MRNNFYLVRHCLTEWNKLSRLQGQTDIELSEEGRNQAKRVAEQLAGRGIGLIVTSDLKRAAETAEIINQLISAKVVVDSRLRECAFGRLEGLTPDEINERFGKGAKQDRCYSDYDFTSFGGENRHDVLRRSLSSISDHTGSIKRGQVLFVSHGRTLNTLLHHFGWRDSLKRGQIAVIRKQWAGEHAAAIESNEAEVRVMSTIALDDY